MQFQITSPPPYSRKRTLSRYKGHSAEMCVCVVCESAIATAMSAGCRLVLSPRWRRGPVPRLRALLWARGGSPSRCRTMSSVRIHPGVPPVTLLRRNFAQALCRQSCARAPAARLRGGTGPWMLRCEAPAPGLQRGAISRLSRATSKLAPLSAAREPRADRHR